MPLRDSWADLLFGRLTLRYGSAFMRQYDGLQPEMVKADWAEVLHGTSAESIKHALEHLPADKPPTAMQFRELCRRAPTPAAAALPPPTDRADPERVRQLVAGIARPPAQRNLAQECYANIRRIVANRGGVWSSAQKHQVRVMHERGLIDASGEAFVQAKEAAC